MIDTEDACSASPSRHFYLPLPMPSASYQSAFSQLSPVIQELIANALPNLFSKQDPGRIQQNAEAETALSVDVLLSFLSSFAEQLQQHQPPENAWKIACYAHQFKGTQLSRERIPTTLGRVKALADHIASILKVPSALNGGMTKERIRKLLLKHMGSDQAPNLEPLLREALLGEYVIWATFNIADTKQNPFDSLPTDRTELCIALGLGMTLRANDPIILLVWDHAASGAPELHRPTIADACDYTFFRPHHDPAHPWGMTEPLQPNAKKHMPQPEIVMRATTSQGLKMPYIILHG